jgi:nucleoid DNA-binding protein
MFGTVNHLIESQIAEELGIPKELVQQVFKHQCSYVAEKMKAREEKIRLFRLGSFSYNKRHEEKYYNSIKKKDENRD